MAVNFDLSKLEGFEWDRGNLDHIQKHNVNYRECEDVFFNKPLIINQDETHSQIEERFRVYGQTNRKRRIFMIFTIRHNKIRVLSSRDQNRKERTEFQKQGGEIHE
jgi:uncharacterized DUF497 family protein